MSVPCVSGVGVPVQQILLALQISQNFYLQIIVTFRYMYLPSLYSFPVQLLSECHMVHSVLMGVEKNETIR